MQSEMATSIRKHLLTTRAVGGLARSIEGIFEFDHCAPSAGRGRLTRGSQSVNLCFCPGVSPVLEGARRNSSSR